MTDEPTKNRTTILLITGMLSICLYIASYYLRVEADSSGVFRIDPRSWPKEAVYPIGHKSSFGKVYEYPLDSFTRPFFAPINGIDRRLRPSVWEE